MNNQQIDQNNYLGEPNFSKTKQNPKQNGNGRPNTPGNYSQQETQVIVNSSLEYDFTVPHAVFDDDEEYEISTVAEVLFRNKRKRIYHNELKLPFSLGEYVIVEVENGVDIGTILSVGKLAEEKLNLSYKN